jgi:hypothetical protein
MHDLPDLLSPPAVFARAFQRLADRIAGQQRAASAPAPARPVLRTAQPAPRRT